MAFLFANFDNRKALPPTKRAQITAIDDKADLGQNTVQTRTLVGAVPIAFYNIYEPFLHIKHIKKYNDDDDIITGNNNTTTEQNEFLRTQQQPKR